MNRRWWVVVWCIIASLGISVPAGAQTEEESAEERGEAAPAFSARIRGELGFLDPLWHKVQFGRDTTYFDYVDEGGQDVLFSFQRLSAEFAFGDRHRAILLYQPLKIATEVVMDRDVTIEGTTFPEGMPVDLTYGFPFYRASYLYDFTEADDREIAAGVSLQLRDATIVFSAADGTRRETNRDVGPVPLLKFRARLPIGEDYWYGAELDGFYAPIRYLNGDADSDVEGAILDASLRAGRELSSSIDAFVNLRYLGGGAQGTSSEDGEDQFTRNWLHFATISLGFSWNIR